MKLQQEKGTGPFVEAYQGDQFKVNGKIYQSSILVQTEKPVQHWPPANLAAVSAADVQQIILLKPTLVLLGTGEQAIFFTTELLVPLYTAQIGIEVMDTAAACRTYNVLMSEGRDVLAALLSQ